MSPQSEALLENELIDHLITLGYKRVVLTDEAAVIQNLKTQLEEFNQVKFSEKEFKQVLNQLNQGSIFERSKRLRNRLSITRDDNTKINIELLNQQHFNKNTFQVANQISMAGTYLNRYDVTLFINGLPLVQIELKRRGIELKEAFNQINRYERHSFGAGYGLFRYIQLYVISNDLNTQYLSNNPINKRDALQCFYWTDEKNNRISKLHDFTETFLNREHLHTMISKYIVLNESQKMLMVLRPYQFYATEAIVNQVRTHALKKEPEYGYIWHTTGSGKTLTSFKTSQILTRLPEVYKVVFVVDRKDLDYQTIKEFNSFSKDSIDGTNNTKTLVNQLKGQTKLIVTTIQKLNNAVQSKRYADQLSHLKDKRIILIFDECHRTQFGDTHKHIKTYFENCQMFGFTGTPIFAENAVNNKIGKRTTKDLFGKQLHSYVITDAIKDENVLKFHVEYLKTFNQKTDGEDMDVEAIDSSEVFDSEDRIKKVVDFIINNHKRKTHHKRFNALLSVSSIPTLVKYYQILKQREEEGKHNLKIATIYSYTANEDDQDVGTFDEDDEFAIAAEPELEYKNKHSREHLDAFIRDYNQMFSTNYSTKDSKIFYDYYKDVAKRVKSRNIDLLIVVNMFLTGFDSKDLNTLYVDKNLKYHGLIQAYSRTNRINGELKSQGNIVCFRNLKEATDDAISLFADKGAEEVIIMPDYEKLVEEFNTEKYISLITIVPSVNHIDKLKTEEQEFEFIKAFREILRLHNKLKVYTEFSYEDLSMNEQMLEDYKTKYLDLYQKVKRNQAKESVSILEDLDFEVELIHVDDIDVTYILNLLAKLKDAPEKDKQNISQQISKALSSSVDLRSKKELIEKFIKENLPEIEDSEEVPERFHEYWSKEKDKAIKIMSEEEHLDSEKLENVISQYLYTEKKPLPNEIQSIMTKKLPLKGRKSTIEKITEKINEFVETFVRGIGAA
jgi:type I restriction enzyme R subunit